MSSGSEKVLERLADGSEIVLRLPGPASALPTFGEVALRYQEATHARHRLWSRRGIAGALAAAVPHIGHLRIDRITRADLQALMVAMQTGRRGPRSPNTIRTMMAWIMGVFRWAADELDVIDKVPRVNRPRAEPNRPTITREEYETLVASPMPPWLLTLVLLMGDAGLRVGEAMALAWTDVVDDAITVRHSRNRREVGPTKSGRTRIVPLTGRLENHLASIERIGEYVHHGTHCTGIVGKHLRRACEKAGVTYAGAHAFRRSFASELVRVGVDIARVRDLLGHQSLSVTNAYVTTSAQSLREAIRMLK